MGIYRNWGRASRVIALCTSVVLLATALVVLPPRSPSASADPVPPSEISLSTNKLTFDAGSTFTLTATVDQLLQDSGSTITITDVTNAVDVKECTSGVDCQIELSFLTGGAREYVATVNSLTSGIVEVGRSLWTIALTTDQEELAAGESALISAEANQDLSATAGAYAIAIFDETRGTRIKFCTSGTVCSVNVGAYADSAARTDYVAVVLSATDSVSDTASTASDVQAMSDDVSVSRGYWALELTSGASELAAGEETWISVAADQDLDDTNGLYSIYIFEMSTDIFIAQCDTGNECDGEVQWGDVEPGGGYFLAVVAERLTTPPTSFGDLPNPIAGSNMNAINSTAWETSLTSDRAELAAGEHATFSAATNMDLGATEGRYEVYIVDWISGDIIKSCDTGTNCELDFSFWYVGDEGYSGAWGSVVGASGATGNYSNIEEWRTASDTLRVDRAYWSAKLEYTGAKTFTLSTNQDASYTHGQWAWYLFSGERGSEYDTTEDVCYSGLRCVLTISAPYASGTYYVALVRANDPSSQAESETWIAGDGMSFLPTEPEPSGPVLDAAQENGGNESTGGRNLAEAACQCGRADPVNSATGDLYLADTDLGVDGVGPVLAVARTYSVSAAGVEGPLGFGWVPNFSASLTQVVPTDDSNPLPRQVEITQENGGTLLFTRVGVSSDYVAPDRVMAELSFESSTVSWLLVRKQSEFLRFDADGHVSSVGDDDGNLIAFSYTGGVLGTVSGSGGRELNLSWTSGRVTAITDSAGRSVGYSYDANGNLASFTGPDGRVTTYEYDSQHRMVAFVVPGGGRTENTYDLDSRVVSQLDPIGRVTSFEYDDAAGTTTTIAPNGSRTVDHYVNGLLISQTLAAGTSSEATTEYAYNKSTQITSLLDPLGGLTTFSYDSNGNRLSQVDQLGRGTNWTYGSAASPLTKTDPVGRVTSVTYSSTGHPVTSETPGGKVETWTYNPDGTLASHVDLNGSETTYEYDLAGRLTEVTDAEARTNEVDYSATGMPTQTTGPDGHTTVTSYDAAGRILEVEDANGNSTTYTYDSAGNIASTSNGEAETTTFTYDGAGRLITTTDPEGGVTALTYDLADNIATITDPNGNAVTATYDHMGNVLTSTDALGRVTTNTYDLRGLLISSTSPSGALSSYERDVAGQVTEFTDSLGHATSLEYNAAGQLVSQEDPLGRITTASFDADGRVAEIELPDLSTQLYEYDDAGNVTKFTNADGLETTYSYTASGLLSSRTEPGGLTTQFDYDEGGRVETTTKPDGTEVAYAYDNVGQIAALDYVASTTSDATYSYDDANRILSIDDGTGSTAFTYDDAGRLTSEIDGSGDQLSYSYDDGGRLTAIAYPGSRSVSYGYDNADQLTSVTDWSSRVTTLTWTLDGGLDTQTSPNGVVQDYSYDVAGQIDTIDVDSTLASIAAFSYTRDNAGQITEQTSNFASSELFAQLDHDLLGQLSGIERDDGLSTPVTIAAAASSGGLLTTSDDGSVLTYNSAQQVTEREPTSGPTVTYSYDDNGARVGATTTSPASATSFSHDPSGALAEVNLPSQGVSYRTDARGLRQERTTSSTEDFLWSTARPLPLLMMDGESLYIHGSTPTPIAQIDQSTDDAIYFHSDILGSVRATTDESGATLGTQTFSEYGSVLTSSGSMGTAFGFTGNWTDEDTGLVHLRARDYDPTTGQFVTVDPALEDTRQPYAYAGNNPVQFTDHTGLDFWEDFATNALAFGAGVLNGVTFGVSGAILSAVVPGYDCFVEAHSGYYMAGDVVGTVGSTIVLSVFSAGTLGVVAMGARLAIGAGARTMAAGARVALRAGAAAVKSGASASARVGSRTAVEVLQTGSRKAASSADELLPGLPTTAPKPLGLGSTGRTSPNSLKEQLAMTEVRSAPAGTPVPMRDPMGDARWLGSEGWEKMSQKVAGIDIHYVRNLISGAVDDFKFK